LLLADDDVLLVHFVPHLNKSPQHNRFLIPRQKSLRLKSSSFFFSEENKYDVYKVLPREKEKRTLLRSLFQITERLSSMRARCASLEKEEEY